MTLLPELRAARYRCRAGIAIGPILFVIAILAVLAGAIAAGSGSFTTTPAQDRARLMAQAILQKANEIKTAVEAVRANGCTPEQISFETSGSQNGAEGFNYANANSPLSTRPHCHVFHPNGGKLQNWPATREWQASRESAVSSGYGTHWDSAIGIDIIGLNRVTSNGSNDYGTAAADLVLRFPFIEQATCAELNRILTGSATIPGGTAVGNFHTRFTGTFASPAESTLTYPGGDRGCGNANGSFFYSVGLVFR